MDCTHGTASDGVAVGLGVGVVVLGVAVASDGVAVGLGVGVVVLGVAVTANHTRGVRDHVGVQLPIPIPEYCRVPRLQWFDTTEGRYCRVSLRI